MDAWKGRSPIIHVSNFATIFQTELVPINHIIVQKSIKTNTLIDK